MTTSRSAGVGIGGIAGRVDLDERLMCGRRRAGPRHCGSSKNARQEMDPISVAAVGDVVTVEAAGVVRVEEEDAEGGSQGGTGAMRERTI